MNTNISMRRKLNPIALLFITFVSFCTWALCYFIITPNQKDNQFFNVYPNEGSIVPIITAIIIWGVLFYKWLLHLKESNDTTDKEYRK
uniref:ORF22 n=1 Tax=Nitrosopumilaceae spindle-shaped virus TaxID=3065433 RepID=A0AAT9JAC0_9VIRU